MIPEMYELSKSKYCKGIQCLKMLWLDQHKPDLAQDTTSDNILKNGVMVGELARVYFGEYSLVETSFDKAAMTEMTRKFLSDGSETIAEASFMTDDNLFCSVDILNKNGDGWDIIEVKSSTGMKDIYIDDMAYQLYVLRKCGVNVKDVYNMHINNTYVRNGELELKELFAIEDCTQAVSERMNDVRDNIGIIRKYLEAENEPVCDIDVYCDTPYDCPYMKYCGRHIPENSVFDLANMQKKTKFKHFHNGIITYSDLLANAKNLKLTAKHIRQIESVLNNSPDEVDKPKIQDFLNTLSYPLYHLDFESYQTPIPEFDGLKPYQQIPFQYSLHIERADGCLEHLEFLAKEGTDPRRALAEQLVKDIPLGVCSLAYNMTFEKMIIRALAESFPDLSGHLMDIHDNMHDLMIPFRDQSYYSAAMQGSYSIKYVLPALYPNDPELDYHNLENVHNGLEASETFATMKYHSPEEIAVLRESLLKYCGLDTFAMVKVLRKIRQAVL